MGKEGEKRKILCLQLTVRRKIILKHGKNKKNLPIYILFLGDREGVATENFIFSLLGESNFALGRGTMFWGVSLWASPPVPLPLPMCTARGIVHTPF